VASTRFVAHDEFVEKLAGRPATSKAELAKLDTLSFADRDRMDNPSRARI
jgi:hypothetical protein